MWMAISLITNDALIQVLRDAILRHGGPSSYADRLGVSCAFVSGMLAGKKNMCGRILDDLGYERVAAFRKVTDIAGRQPLPER